MTKTTKENIFAFIFMGILAFLAVYIVARDIDKDCERECGLKPYANAPEYCRGFWEAKGLMTDTDDKIAEDGIHE